MSMASSQDVMYAVAVRDVSSLRLFCRIRRSRNGDIYVLMPRDEPGWDPHASYHSDGWYHIRSHGWKHLPTLRQKPDASFRGVETVFEFTIQPGEASTLSDLCTPQKFNDVFEIPLEDLPPGEYHPLRVDLVEPGKDVHLAPWREHVRQKCFRDREPWLLVSLWRGLWPSTGEAQTTGPNHAT